MGFWTKYDAKRTPEQRQHRREHNRLIHQSLRSEVVAAYGGACPCGSLKHLQVDHVFDDGPADRANGLRGSTLYRWLKKMGFPRDRFQLLCASCNKVKFLAVEQVGR